MSLNLEMKKNPGVSAGMKTGLKAESCLPALQNFCVEKFARLNFCILKWGHSEVDIWQIV